MTRCRWVTRFGAVRIVALATALAVPGVVPRAWAGPAQAAQSPSADNRGGVEVLQVRDGVYLLAGVGGNIVPRSVRRVCSWWIPEPQARVTRSSPPSAR